MFSQIKMKMMFNSNNMTFQIDDRVNRFLINSLKWDIGPNWIWGIATRFILNDQKISDIGYKSNISELINNY